MHTSRRNPIPTCNLFLFTDFHPIHTKKSKTISLGTQFSYLFYLFSSIHLPIGGILGQLGQPGDEPVPFAHDVTRDAIACRTPSWIVSALRMTITDDDHLHASSSPLAGRQLRHLQEVDAVRIIATAAAPL